MANGLTGTGRPGLKGSFYPPAGRPHLFKVFEVVAKPSVGGRAVLETLQVGFEFGGRFRWEPINHPRLVPRAFNQPALSQVSEVLRNLGLGKPQDLLKVANAQRSMGQQMKDSKPCRITEALVNANQLHTATMAAMIYSSTTIYFDAVF